KNSVTALEKELDDASDDNAQGAGDIITWNVSATAPQLAPGDELNEYSFVDDLDSRLDFENVANFTYGGQDWTEGNQYTVSQDGQVVTITLTEAGRAAIVANHGQELSYQINTVIAEGTDLGNGVIENDITQYTTVNDDDYDVTTPKDQTNWGT